MNGIIKDIGNEKDLRGNKANEIAKEYNLRCHEALLIAIYIL